MFVYPCKVLDVVDGDTIDVEIDLGFNIKLKERVRLLGVDTPEVFGPNAEPAGTVASDFTKTWIEQRKIQLPAFQYASLKYNRKDKYGRSLGELFWIDASGNKQSLNEAIKAAGLVKSNVKV